jgi:predicted MFS family arabinose efflux permease
MLVTVFNLAVAGGGMVGGLLLEPLGAGSFHWALAVPALFSLSVVSSAKVHGFRPGHRVAAA